MGSNLDTGRGNEVLRKGQPLKLFAKLYKGLLKINWQSKRPHHMKKYAGGNEIEIF